MGLSWAGGALTVCLWPPSGLGGEGHAQICQRYKNRHHFATLYRRQDRTALYSAYLVTVGMSKRPPARWKYEPQLANSKASPEMQRFPKNGSVDQNVLDSQAVLQDYAQSGYTRGHLSPSLHHATREAQRATFTLTNVVPQQKGSNSGPWAVLEREVWARLGAHCTGLAYVVTGALPYRAPRHIAGRVAVPEYLWTAYCCPAFNASLPPQLRPFFPSYAAIGRNDPLSDESMVPVDPAARRAVRGYDVRRMPLGAVETHLAARLGGGAPSTCSHTGAPPPPAWGRDTA
ncbi:hypothetical protein COCON_G00113910 [Conger conger]|uniref:Endonuclease n=1 Tax=Conger conger TaxID=82655 RepID=A0A9Q1DFE5_CONCO|nr:hypothetical protein COCON_G00113910 [Conger conger]